MAKYPPAQGLALAAGTLMLGDPWWGVWVPFACGAAAVCWMLQGWTTNRWALLGGLITAVHPAMHNYLAFSWHTMHLFSWSQSFWGGGVAMLGAALFLGGIRRIAGERRAWPCFWMCVGLMILANSRPFEGVLVVVPTLGCLLAIYPRRARIAPQNGSLMWPDDSGGPTAIPLLIGFAWMLCYNKAVTNSFLKFPYMIYEQRHTVTPLFWWQPKRTIISQDPAVMVWDYSHIQHRKSESDYATWRDVLAVSYDKIQTTTSFFFGVRRWYLVGPFCLLFVGVTVLLATGTWSRIAVCVCCVFAAGVAQATYYLPHYAAPVYPLLLYLSCRFLRYCAWRHAA